MREKKESATRAFWAITVFFVVFVMEANPMSLPVNSRKCFPPLLLGLFFGLEHFLINRKSPSDKILITSGDAACRLVGPENPSVAVDARLLKNKDVLQLQLEIIGHSFRLGDPGDLSGPVRKAVDVDNDINGRGNHFVDRPDRQFDAA